MSDDDPPVGASLAGYCVPMSGLDILFSPYRLNGLTLPNRVVVPQLWHVGQKRSGKFPAWTPAAPYESPSGLG